MNECGRDTGGQVGREKSDTAETVLDVVAIDPQEEHVAGKMHEAGVEKHRREQGRRRRRHRTKAVVEDDEVVGRDLSHQLCRRHSL